MYLYQLLKGSVLENKFLSLDFCTNDNRRKREFSDSQRDSLCLQTSKECFSRHALNDIHSLGLNELMTKAYSPYFKDRKTRAKGETARSQTSWGAVVLKMRCRFQILGLYGECRLTCELSFLLLKKKKKRKAGHILSKKTMWFTFE